MVVLARASSALLLSALVAAAGGCGTLAPEEPLPPGLAVAGTGAYTRLDVERATLLEDAQANLEDAHLLVDGEALQIVYTRRTGEGPSLRRARFPSLDDRGVAFDDLGGNGAGASQPAVLAPESPGGAFLLCFERSGRIECADSPDGDRFAARADLTLASDGEGEGGALGSPALVRMGGEERVRLYYLAGAPGDARVFAADAAYGRGPFVRVDRVPQTPARDPIIAPGAAPWLPSIGRITARAIRTGADRVRYDLLVTGVVERARVCGLLASWDGTRFSPAAAPLLDARAPEEWAPSAAAWRGGHLLVFSVRSVGRSVIAAATNP